MNARKNIRRIYLVLAASLVPLPLFAAEPQAFEAVRINGIGIPVSSFESALQVAESRGAADTPELRTYVRAQVIAQEVLCQEAAKKKLQNDPAVVAARDAAAKAAETQAMIQRYLALTLKPSPVTDADVRARYDAIRASLGDTEYKASVIAVGSEAEARDLLAKLQQGNVDFADLARQYSTLPSRANGGALDWISFPVPVVEGNTQHLPIAIARALSALKPQTVSADPIAVDGRYYLLRLDESRATHIPAYAEAAPGLRHALEAQAMQRASAELMQQLLKNAKVE